MPEDDDEPKPSKKQMKMPKEDGDQSKMALGTSNLLGASSQAQKADGYSASDDARYKTQAQLLQSQSLLQLQQQL